MLLSTIDLLRVIGCILMAEREENSDKWTIHWYGRRHLRGDGQATNGTCRRQTGTKSMFAGLQAVKVK
jgi:hypothetical protein